MSSYGLQVCTCSLQMRRLGVEYLYLFGSATVLYRYGFALHQTSHVARPTQNLPYQYARSYSVATFYDVRGVYGFSICSVSWGSFNTCTFSRNSPSSIIAICGAP